MDMKALADAKRFGKGTSKAAIRRRLERTRGVTQGHQPGEYLDSRGRRYVVAADGSHRRVAA